MRSLPYLISLIRAKLTLIKGGTKSAPYVNAAELKFCVQMRENDL